MNFCGDGGQNESDTLWPPAPVAALRDPVLAVLAAQLLDYEKARLAAENRLRIMTKAPDEADEDGVCRGLGLSPLLPEVAALREAADGLARVEKGVEKTLVVQVRKHPLYAWVERTGGIGEKTAARLLGVLGDPYWHSGVDADEKPRNRPRTVGELFAYCGLHGPNGRRRRGQMANWNAEAKVRLHLMAENCMKMTGEPDKNGRARGRSPFRDVYDAARVRYANKVHTEVCAGCGPSGKPAEVGSPWSDKHKHNGAMRIVKREILRALWEEAKRIHEVQAVGPPQR